MFSQLFFVLLALSLINFTPESGLDFWASTPSEAFFWGFLSYFVLLTLLLIQTKALSHSPWRRLKSFWPSVVNIEILIFLCLYHFGFGTHRFFMQGIFSNYHTPFILVSLLLYFMALSWAHVWDAHLMQGYSFQKSIRESLKQLLFFCPFCIPFIIITLFLDSLEHLPLWLNHSLPIDQDLIVIIFSLTLLGGTILFLPPLMVVCWRCTPLKQFDLKNRLERLCTVLQFKHAGLKSWSMIPHTFTAGIIGVVAPLRYILFTPALIARFKPEEIEAILVHEIGHNRYRHLLYYPLILFGMLVFGAIGLTLLEEQLQLIFGTVSEKMLQVSFIIILFSVYALLIGFYFRFIFGFFSRLFERQADLYIFESPLEPHTLIQALDRLGVVTGYTHHQPSWHHDSLQARIRFLRAAMDNPSLIQQHHQRVKKWLLIYVCSLIIGCLILFFYFS